MADFTTAYRVVMKNEGGYSNAASDRGGETYKGISRVKWPSWEGWVRVDFWKTRDLFPRTLDIDEQLDAMVLGFYKRNFWDPVRADEIKSQEVATELFDTSVNTGIKSGIRFLQESLNVLNNQGIRWRDIPADGIMGDGTIAALNSCIGHKLDDVLLVLMNGRQLDHYYKLMLCDPSQEANCVGWIRWRVSMKG